MDSLRPDVILMDLRMPRLGGAATIKALAERGAEAKVLVLTTYDTDRDVVPALEAGATGYLLKDAPATSSFAPSMPPPAASRCSRHRSRPGSSHSSDHPSTRR